MFPRRCAFDTTAQLREADDGVVVEEMSWLPKGKVHAQAARYDELHNLRFSLPPVEQHRHPALPLLYLSYD